MAVDCAGDAEQISFAHIPKLLPLCFHNPSDFFSLLPMPAWVTAHSHFYFFFPRQQLQKRVSWRFN